jgi:hypothetical protein
MSPLPPPTPGTRSELQLPPPIVLSTEAGAPEIISAEVIPGVPAAAEEPTNSPPEEPANPRNGVPSDAATAEARQRVKDAHRGTSETERQELFADVIQAAQGRTIISTVIPNDLIRTNGDKRHIVENYFGMFGDGVREGFRQSEISLLSHSGSFEAMMFTRVYTQRYIKETKTIEKRRLFRTETSETEESVKGPVESMTIDNPVTGEQEPAVVVAYQFRTGSRQHNGKTVLYEGPTYMSNGRPGNSLIVQTILPFSVAAKLFEGVSNDPLIAREFAEILAKRNGITEKSWDGLVRPPYDQLPADWEMGVVQSKIIRDQGITHPITREALVRVVR